MNVDLFFSVVKTLLVAVKVAYPPDDLREGIGLAHVVDEFVNGGRYACLEVGEAEAHNL